MTDAKPAATAPAEPVEARLNALVDELFAAGFFSNTTLHSVEMPAPIGRQRMRITIDGPPGKVAVLQALWNGAIHAR